MVSIQQVTTTVYHPVWEITSKSVFCPIAEEIHLLFKDVIVVPVARVVSLAVVQQLL